MAATFLVENYSPGLSVEGFEAASYRLSAEADAMTREGKVVQVLRSTIVPADESLICVCSAESRALVCEAFRRAGVSFDRISEALTR
jgi:Protein of unknown function (DUF4242)